MGKTTWQNTWLLHPEEYITARVLKPQYAKPKMPLIFTGYQSNAQTYDRAHYTSLHKQVNEGGRASGQSAPYCSQLTYCISKLCLYKDSLASQMFPLQVLLLLLQKWQCLMECGLSVYLSIYQSIYPISPLIILRGDIVKFDRENGTGSFFLNYISFIAGFCGCAAFWVQQLKCTNKGRVQK